ncbi:hypothetical protein [Prevotella corporis]|uniref:hypothetical protein n=1 Tax=Prevotella corporis TaxID=28128 RepID=UPI00042615D7|nr:hypothetical protein [Prevotella corporis]MDQ7737714.1 hypothetical protein [Prevotella corporis]
MKKKYQQPLIDILIINPKDLLKTVNASGEDDAAGAKQFDFDDSVEDDDKYAWSEDDFK